MVSYEELNIIVPKIRAVQSDVYEERIRQLYQWGEQRHPLGEWLKILVEEVGEVAQAMQQGSKSEKVTDAQNLYKELIQVSAVAQAIAEHVRELDESDSNAKDDD